MSYGVFSDPFLEAFLRLEQTGEVARLQEKYDNPKTFNERFRRPKKVVKALSYLFNTVSVITGLTFLFFLCLFFFGSQRSLVQILEGPTSIKVTAGVALAFSLVLLIGPEYLKRHFLADGWKYALTLKRYKTLLVALVLSVSSVGVSYLGGFRVAGEANEFAKKEQIALIRDTYEPEIKRLRAEADMIHTQSNWKGVTTRDARPQVLALREQANAQAALLESEVEAIRVSNADKVQLWFALAQFLNEFCIWLCFIFMEYYDKRSKEEIHLMEEHLGKMGAAANMAFSEISENVKTTGHPSPASAKQKARQIGFKVGQGSAKSKRNAGAAHFASSGAKQKVTKISPIPKRSKVPLEKRDPKSLRDSFAKNFARHRKATLGGKEVAPSSLDLMQRQLKIINTIQSYKAYRLKGANTVKLEQVSKRITNQLVFKGSVLDIV